MGIPTCKSILIYMLAMSFKLWGLLPFKINISTRERESGRKKNRYNFSYSLVGSVYNIILIVIYIYFMYFFIHNLFFQKKFSIISLPFFEIFLSVISNSIAIILLIIVTIKQKTMIIVASKLINLQVKSNLNPINSKKKFSFDEFLLITIVVLYYFIYFLIIITEPTNIMIFTKNDIFWILYSISGFFIGYALILYILVLFRVKSEFYKLNQSLELVTNIAATKNDYYIIPVNTRYVDVVIQDIFRIKSDQFIFCEYIRAFSRFCSVPIFLATLYCCIDLIYTSYCYFMYFLLSKEYKLKRSINFLSWIMKALFPLSILTLTVTSTTSEINKTKSIVCRAINTNHMNIQIKYELEQFFSELLHCNIIFTACHLFSLNNSLMRTILNTVLTYMIVFVQLKKNELSKNSTPSYYDDAT